MRLKYIMFLVDRPGNPQYFPIIFSESQVHFEVAEAMRHMKCGSPTNWVRPEPVSAGFLTFDSTGPEAVRCFGESESLKLVPHFEDPAIIRSMSYAHGLGFEARKSGKGEAPESG